MKKEIKFEIGFKKIFFISMVFCFKIVKKRNPGKMKK